MAYNPHIQPNNPYQQQQQQQQQQQMQLQQQMHSPAPMNDQSSVHTVDTVSGEQYRYALANFVCISLLCCTLPNL
jgi:hypothetical protein